MTDIIKLNKKELLQVAEAFAVNTEDSPTAAMLRVRFEEDGITQRMIDDYFGEIAALEVAAKPTGVITSEDVTQTGAVQNDWASQNIKPSPAPVPAAALDTHVLLRMTRENGTFEIRGYRFTKEHPFALVEAEDAQAIMDAEEGFRP